MSDNWIFFSTVKVVTNIVPLENLKREKGDIFNFPEENDKFELFKNE